MSVHVVEVLPGPDRDRYLPLLRLADDSEQEICSYIHRGQLYGLLQPDMQIPCGHVLTLNAGSDVVELKSVAIAEAYQGQGLGRQLITTVLERLRLRGIGRVVVGTSSSSVGVLAFYQKLGFRPWKVERDRFTPAHGYPEGLLEQGIPVRDMIWLDLDL